MPKRTVLLLYGGRSGEHDVSIQSAKSVAITLQELGHDIIPICIGADGVWRLNDRYQPNFTDGAVRIFLPQPGMNTLLNVSGQMTERFDIVFPIIHGTYGEDGCLQGLLEMAEVPYVGSGVLGSALGMDKAVQKMILKQAGIQVVEHVVFNDIDWEKKPKEVISSIKKSLEFPVFVKPANMGSSVGISKVNVEFSLKGAISKALKYDTKIIVEQGVRNTREIECSAICGPTGNMVSEFGEIESANDYYDYEAKYQSDDTVLVIPADLPDDLADSTKEIAKKACWALETYGMARVDFLLDDETGEFYLNEINTLPGFTDKSMYPKLWEKTGMSRTELVESLLVLAFERQERKRSLSRQHIGSS